jgi:hypothetical protein
MLHLIVLAMHLHAPWAHVAAALDAATPEAPADVLLAVAWHEGKYDPGWINVSLGCRTYTEVVERSGNDVDVEHRTCASHETRRLPLGSFPAEWSYPYRCGTLQQTVFSEDTCRQLAADVQSQYRQAVATMHVAHAWCRDHESRPGLRCALEIYAAGPTIHTGDRHFAQWVLRVTGRVPTVAASAARPPAPRPRAC